jgi:protein gp37
MSQTQIEWTHRPGTVGETLNPTTCCNKVDRGCKNCYAEIMHARLRAMGSAKYQSEFLGPAQIHPEVLDIPFKWHKPRTVFVNSMSDLFHPAVPFQFIRRFFEVMEQTPQHTYLILTKRPEVALAFARYLSDDNNALVLRPWPPNVWVGTSIHNQNSADLRVPLVLQLPAAVIFLSFEPTLGACNLRSVGTYEERIDALNGVKFRRGSYEAEHRMQRRLDWVIMGGESGPKADPMHPDWVRQVRDDCKRAKVPFFFKQWGAWEPREHLKLGAKDDGRKVRAQLLRLPRLQEMVHTTCKDNHVLDGEVWQQFPEVPLPLPKRT